MPAKHRLYSIPDKPGYVMTVTVCIFCGNEVMLEVFADDYDRWLNKGEYIQKAFNYLTPAQREILISGICGECFDDEFKEEV